MSKSSSGGNNSNVVNFDILTTIVISYGPPYNPMKELLKVPKMQGLVVTAKNIIAAVNAAETAFESAKASRDLTFLPVDKTLTRVGNSIKSSDISAQVVENVVILIKKIKGQRIGAKPTAEEIAAAEAAGKTTRQVSATHSGFDSRIENFDKLLKLINTIPQYTPNEADIKLAALTTLYNDMKAKQAAVVQASIALTNARIQRNDILYKPSTGLVDIANDVKLYVKSVFGATSPQAKQLAKLRFVSMK